MKRRAFTFRTSLRGRTEYTTTDAMHFTDIASNAVVLDDINPLEMLKELREGRLDTSYLRPFLHEATHHVTFDSAVGSTLGVLWASCAGREIEALLGQYELTRPLFDLAKYRFAHTLLQPLIEGLALFAEHDAVPGSSLAASRISSYTLRIFSIGRCLIDLFKNSQLGQASSFDPWSYQARYLETARRSSEWIEGKALLLKQPLGSEHRYLLGYLTVKAMYRQLSRVTERFADPDLFLLFMISYWFCDYGLTKLLLADLEQQPSAERMNQSLIELLTHFKNHLTQMFSNADSYASVCETSYAKVRGGVSLLHEDTFIKRLPSYCNYDPTYEFTKQFLLAWRAGESITNVFWPKVWAYRGDFRFSCMRVQVTIDESQWVVVRHPIDERELLSVRGVKNACQGEGEGTIESVLLRDLETVIVGVFAGDGLAAVLNPKTGNWNEIELVDYLDDMPSFVEIEGAMNTFAQKQHAPPGSLAHEVVTHWEKRAHQAVVDLYLPLAFAGTSGKSLEEVRAALEVDGLLSVLGSEDLLTFAAQLSLVCGVRPTNTRRIAEVLSVPVDVVRQTVETINELSINQLGFNLFMICGDSLESRI